MAHLTVAIQHDDYGTGNAAAPRWRAYLEARGVAVRTVDVWRHDILRQLAGVQGLMWRFAQYTNHRQLARRLLPALERHTDILLYPDQNTSWHYDDKIAQAYLFELLDIATPKTWVFFSQPDAEDWLDSASYPLVLKLATGAGASNVRLLRSRRQAAKWLAKLFSGGLESLDEARLPTPLRRVARAGAEALAGRGLYSEKYWERHKNYALFQQFLPGNDFDTRVTVIGERAFGFRRNNRPGDFRASGSGNIDHDPDGVDPRFIELAFETADKLKMQSVAIDGLYDAAKKPCVGEVSYTYMSKAIYDCPGHWKRDLSWQTGQLWPEDAQAEDFLARLHEHFDRRD
jgi:hypothetical protein